jgi:membrane protein YdbS with pleckstrin-like domain
VVLGLIFTLGLYEIWRRRDTFVLDSGELTKSRGVVLVRQEQVLPISRVQDIAVKRILWWARLTVSTAGGFAGIVDAGPYSVGEARLFAETVRAQLAALHPATSGVG